MQGHLGQLFEDEETLERIKNRLLNFFQILKRKLGKYAF
jgi:hypothetical protein